MANAEHLEILKSGVEKWNEWREENKDIKPYLSGANLIGADLSGANLFRADLIVANLFGADLSGANLSEADLSGANLSEADLSGANLSGAVLIGANLFGADLREANLSRANLLGANLFEADLNAANLIGAGLNAANLYGANLTESDLRGADLRGANLTESDLRGADLRGADLKGAVLKETNLTRDNRQEITKPMKSINFAICDIPRHYTLKFDGIFPSPFYPRAWQDLLVYVYFEYAIEKVIEDFEQRKQSLSGTYSGTTATSQYQIPRDSLLTIIPEIPSVVCNPPSMQFRMTEDYHCLQFRVMHQPTQLVERLGNGRITGTIRIYLETLLIGEIPVESDWEIPGQSTPRSVLVSSITPLAASTESKTSEFKRQTAQQFRKIFASYCHKDIPIVERLEKAYRALGDDVWRDLPKLRSGENWSDAIEKAINDCDVFQLCWSSNAKTSEYVEIEWRTALKRELEGLIRPVYWENPLPEPPNELSHLHFSHYPLEE